MKKQKMESKTKNYKQQKKNKSKTAKIKIKTKNKTTKKNAPFLRKFPGILYKDQQTNVQKNVEKNYIFHNFWHSGP